MVPIEQKDWTEGDIASKLGQNHPLESTKRLISFVANNTEVLKVFVERTFHNPALVQIIELISKIGIAH